MDLSTLDKRKLHTIADYYGFDMQQQITIEECSELIKALCKRQRKWSELDTPIICESPERSSIITEIADVQIMIWQLEYLLDSEQEVRREIGLKLNRQIDRINNEEQSSGNPE